MDKRNFFSRLLMVIWVASLLAVLFLFVQSLCSCSASRKCASEARFSVDSVSHVSKEVSVDNAEITEQSASYMSLIADSVMIFPLRISQERDDPPDSVDSPRIPPKMVLPAFAASLYGVRLDISNACSSSLDVAGAHVSDESDSSVAVDADSKESASAQSQSPPTLWGVIVFIFLILAVLMLMRYLDK